MGILTFQAAAGGALNLNGPNIAGTVNLTLPSADGTSGQPLQTNGSGTLSFATLGTTAGGTGLTSFTSTGIPYASSTSALTTGSALTFDGTNLATTGSLNSTNTFGFKNRIINGGMVIDQRNAGASVTVTSVNYVTDRFFGYANLSNKYTLQQNAGSVTPPAGFTKYLGATSSANTTLGAGDFNLIVQRIEGYNIGDLAWGTASASAVTLSFRVYSSLTGTFGGSLLNGLANRSYPFTYSIPTANTWTTISVTVAGDTSGTWATDNSNGMSINFGLGVGTTYSGTAGSWSGSAYFSATGATSVVGTSGATFYITGVQLEKGSTATSFDYRPYGTELALCQRYYQTTSNAQGIASSTTQCLMLINWATTMRSSPTVGLTGVYSITDVYTADFTQSTATVGSTLGFNTGTSLTYLSAFTGLTAGRAYLTRFANSNIITLSAEL